MWRRFKLKFEYEAMPQLSLEPNPFSPSTLLSVRGRNGSQHLKTTCLRNSLVTATTPKRTFLKDCLQAFFHTFTDDAWKQRRLPTNAPILAPSSDLPARTTHFVYPKLTGLENECPTSRMHARNRKSFNHAYLQQCNDTVSQALHRSFDIMWEC